MHNNSFRGIHQQCHPMARDHGKKPLVIDIENETRENGCFRTALWTGDHFQITLMSIPIGGEIGLETHPNVDQFLRIEDGEGRVIMGYSRESLDFFQCVRDGYAIVIPAKTWHNVINTGNRPIKLYSIYAPPQHPWGTVHRTKAESDAAEAHG